jgi:putative peptidoglycan lipid II flippase
MVRRLYFYNLLNVLQVLFGVVFQLLLAKRFGAGAESDAYFLSTTAVTFLSALSLLFSEMFLQHYNDLYVSDPADAERFYQAVFTQSLLIGLVVCIGSALGFTLIVKVLAPGLEPKRLSLFGSFFTIHAVSLVWIRAMTLNNTLINAHMRFLLPYLLGILAHVVNMAFLLLGADSLGINAIAFAAVSSGFLSVVIQQAFIAKKLGVRPRLRLWHQNVRKLAASSVPLRLAHQIWSLRDILTTNVLAGFPVGSLSVFSYAMKIVTTMFSVTNSPILQIFQAKASRLMSEGRVSEIHELRKAVTVKNAVLFAAMAGSAAVLLPFVLQKLFARSISQEMLKNIYLIFICLIPTYTVMTLEMPLVQVVIALKQGTRVLQINSVFVAAYFAALFSLIGSLGIYGIAAAMFFAQSVNIVLYLRLVSRDMRGLSEVRSL